VGKLNLPEVRGGVGQVGAGDLVSVATIWRTGGAPRACAAMRQLDKELARKPLGGLVCRFQLGNVHRKIKHYLDRFGVGMGVIVAVNVYLELPTVANDPLPPRLE
jgi:hypothetical protein